MSKMNQIIFYQHEIDGEQFSLNPSGEKNNIYYYDGERAYGNLHRYAQFNFGRHSETTQTCLNTDGFEKLEGLLPAATCRNMIDHFETGGVYFKSREGAFNLMEAIFNEAVDREIISHFGSEYMPLWYNFTKDSYDSTEDNCSFKWHCDGGPSKHLKIMVYLNGCEEHGANTWFSNKQVTRAFKDLGYIFCRLDQRRENLSKLAKACNIDLKENYFNFKAGDAVIFNPFEVMHRGKRPDPGKARYVLHLCIVPSPVCWRDAMETIRWPTPDFCDFSNIFNVALHANRVASDKKPDLNDLILIEEKHKITSQQYLEVVVYSIFKDPWMAQLVVNNILLQDFNLEKINSLDAILNFTKIFFQEKINSQENTAKMLSHLQEAIEFESETINSSHVYNDRIKPNPGAVRWPDPDNKRYPVDIHQLLPYVQSNVIADKKTAIGSAGSCFAFEISREFQEQGFNYVVTERPDNLEDGVLVDGYAPGDPFVRFCANYGILFNTPSFRQLAEKAFHKKEFPKLLSQEGKLYMDPYRENVYFASPQAYLADYNRHVNAVREAFMACKVFIITLGLNECWEFKRDHTVISRNPKAGMYHLLRPKILTVQENIDNLQTFLDIIREFNPEFRLVVSVSPVPFLASFQAHEKHVVTANSHSKAVLRVAAEEFVNQNAGVYYLPSYELVTQCSSNPWERDNRHVKPETVKRVIRLFKEMFVSKQDW